MAAFARYVGIDYSGAKTPQSSLTGLRVYLADRESEPAEVLPPASARKYWSRRGVAEWLVDRLSEPAPTLVGIDHAFSFPLQYFEEHRLGQSWSDFLDDFQSHWPTDRETTTVEDVRTGRAGDGSRRAGQRRWRRVTEVRARAAKSVFHFDVQGSVAKSTHAGLPWLRYLRHRLGGRCHFWPFDGWDIPDGRSAIVEVYPRLWSRSFESEDRTGDQHDAYSVAAWLRSADLDGRLQSALKPTISDEDREAALVEGWILGVPSETEPRPSTAARNTRSALSRPRRSGGKATTEPGYVSKNNQEVLRKTDLAGNHHNQVVYVLRCKTCGHEYGANGADIWLRRCPSCDGGAPGLDF